MRMNLEEDFVIIGEPFSRHARKARGITNTKDILRYVQQAPNDINWTFDQAEFDDHLALKKNSAPGPDGIPYGVSRCAGGLGSKLLFSAHKAVLEGSTIPDCFAESRTVFIPKTSDIHDHGRIIRSPDALRPLTLSANSLLPAICRPLLFVEAFTGTLCDAFTPHRDASHLGKGRTTSLKLRPRLWPMSRVLRKNQVFS